MDVFTLCMLVLSGLRSIVILDVVALASANQSAAFFESRPIRVRAVDMCPCNSGESGCIAYIWQSSMTFCSIHVLMILSFRELLFRYLTDFRASVTDCLVFSALGSNCLIAFTSILGEPLLPVTVQIIVACSSAACFCGSE